MNVGIFNNLFTQKKDSKQMKHVIKTEFTAELGTYRTVMFSRFFKYS